jgi:hypothetical protein
VSFRKNIKDDMPGKQVQTHQDSKTRTIRNRRTNPTTTGMVTFAPLDVSP